MKYASSKEMRRIDAVAIKKYGIPSIVLMENAGIKVYKNLCTMAKPPADICIVAGKGNNGGDAFVVARHCVNAGFTVSVILICEETDLSVDAKTNYSILKAMKVKCLKAVRTRNLRKIAPLFDLRYHCGWYIWHRF